MAVKLLGTVASPTIPHAGGYPPTGVCKRQKMQGLEFWE